MSFARVLEAKREKLSVKVSLACSVDKGSERSHRAAVTRVASGDSQPAARPPSCGERGSGWHAALRGARPRAAAPLCARLRLRRRSGTGGRCGSPVLALGAQLDGKSLGFASTRAQPL